MANAVTWTSASICCDNLLSHPSYPTFTVTCIQGSDQTFISTFSAALRNPLLERRVKVRLDKIGFLPSSTPSTQHFVGIVKNGEIYRFGDLVSSIAPRTIRGIGQAATAKPLSIWQEMFGKEAFLEDLGAAPESALPPRIRKVGKPSDVFDGPSHTLPPVGLLFDAFMDELLAAKPAKANKDASVAVDGIIHEGPTPLIAAPEPEVEKSRSRPVTDEEVRDLEVFFRDILTTSECHPSSQAYQLKPTSDPPTAVASSKPRKSLPNGHAHSQNGDILPMKTANGVYHSESGDEAEPLGDAVRTGTPVAILPNGHAATSEEDEEKRKVSDIGDAGKKRGRKRRASKEA